LEPGSDNSDQKVEAFLTNGSVLNQFKLLVYNLSR